jgi:hypothetical protein
MLQLPIFKFMLVPLIRCLDLLGHGFGNNQTHQNN